MRRIGTQIELIFKELIREILFNQFNLCFNPVSLAILIWHSRMESKSFKISSHDTEGKNLPGL